MKKNKQIGMILIISVIIFKLVNVAYAVPMNASYQGFLLDNNGSPINGSVSITFNLYATKLDNQSLWNETHKDVLVTDGIFYVILGTENSFTNDLFRHELYLGISIDEDIELSPRNKFTSSIYAIRAAIAESVDGINITDHSIDITKLSFSDQEGNIEIPGNISANTFIGDGSQLTGIVKKETDPVWTKESSKYWTKEDLKRNSSREYSGSFNIGVFDSFYNSNSSNLQDVLDDFDVAISKKIDLQSTNYGLWNKAMDNFYYENGSVGIGTSNINEELQLDVEGKIGGTELCDQDGLNCKKISDIVTNEKDPKVGDQISGKWCKSNGNQVVCTSDEPSQFVRGGLYGLCSKNGSVTYPFSGSGNNCQCPGGFTKVVISSSSVNIGSQNATNYKTIYTYTCLKQ